MALVSIIIPSYNHISYLEERLNSIFNQNFQDYEVIILDDASTDGSVELLKRYASNSKVKAILVNKENSGSPFIQWEKGLRLAKGEYIWIAESDDTCHTNFLERQLEQFDKHKNASIVVAKTVKYNKGKSLGEVSHPIFKEDNTAIINQGNINFCPILNVSCCVFKNPNLNYNTTEFTKYKLIGDRVFYHEFFYNHVVVKNSNTISYFRKEEESVSTLKYKGLSYLRKYFNEHVNFIDYVFLKGEINNKVYNAYKHKFFARVRDRLSKKQKLNFVYLDVYLTYKFGLKK